MVATANPDSQGHLGLGTWVKAFRRLTMMKGMGLTMMKGMGLKMMKGVGLKMTKGMGLSLST